MDSRTLVRCGACNRVVATVLTDAITRISHFALAVVRRDPPSLVAFGVERAGLLCVECTSKRDPNFKSDAQ